MQRDAAFCYGIMDLYWHDLFFFPNMRVVCWEKRIDHAKETTFTISGYKGWKRAVGDKTKGLALHNHCLTHLRAMQYWPESKIRIETDSTVAMIVSCKVLEKNRYYVCNLAEVVQFLPLNELTFRSEHDKSTLTEMYILAKDGKLSEIHKTTPDNAKYTSPEIENVIRRKKIIVCFRSP